MAIDLSLPREFPKNHYFCAVMKTRVSKILMCVAAFMMLLMSSVPHHHHCGQMDGHNNLDFICFASQGLDSGCTADKDCGHCHDGDHGSESCRIHSIVTLLERVQNIPSYQPALEFIVPQVIVLEAAESDAADSPRIVIKEKLSSFYLVRSKGLRAPPFLAV